MRCTHCSVKLVENARYCHNCGEKVIGQPIDCPSCETINESNAKFCKACGCALGFKPMTKGIDYQAHYPLNFKEMGKLKDQIGTYFFTELKKKLVEEQDVKLYEQYVRHFYDSGFDKQFDKKAEQLADEAYTIHLKQDETVDPTIDNLLKTNFDALIDHFMIMHCKTINPVSLSENILKYQNAKRDDVILGEMIHDYLDLENESREKFYLNFLKIPENKMKNAAQSFLFADAKEMIYVLGDQTVFGSCKEGFALTERGIYWKHHFHKAYAVFYDNLQEIKKENEWITINGRYFHVNASFDLKLMKLLKKIKKIR